MDTTITLTGTAAGKAAGPFGTGASKASESSVYVLEELSVHEVSSVDRPANKRKWTMIKSEDGTPDNTSALIPDGKGGFVTKAVSPAPVATQPAAGEVAKSAADAAAATAAAEEAAKAAQAKEAADKAAAEAAAVEAAKAAEVAAAAVKATEAAAALAAAKAAEEAAQAATKATADVEVELGEETVKALSDAVSLAKAGRKLSSERKTKLRGIVQQLSDLLAEVEDAAKKADTSVEARKALEAQVAELTAKLTTIEATNKSLTGQVEELTAAQKGMTQVGQAGQASQPASFQASETGASAKQTSGVNWSALTPRRR